MKARTTAAILAATMTAAQAFAQPSAPTASMMLEGVPPGETIRLSYRCTGPAAALGVPSGLLRVTYYNSRDNNLAVLALEGGPRVFANVIAGSGARYAGGALEWWTKGDEASLSRVGEEARALCTAIR